MNSLLEKKDHLYALICGMWQQKTNLLALMKHGILLFLLNI